jgi:hypothetical protein
MLDPVICTALLDRMTIQLQFTLENTETFSVQTRYTSNYWYLQNPQLSQKTWKLYDPVMTRIHNAFPSDRNFPPNIYGIKEKIPTAQ